MVDPQLKQAMANGSFSGVYVAPGDCVLSGVFTPFSPSRSLDTSFVSSRFITTRLLYAGQPLQATDPPVPLHLPSPLHDPCSVFVIAVVLGGLFKFTGRWLLLDLRYKPHALHISVPSGALLQSGVLVVPQFEHCWPSSPLATTSAFSPPPVSVSVSVSLLFFSFVALPSGSSFSPLARRFLPPSLIPRFRFISVRLVVVFCNIELVIGYMLVIRLVASIGINILSIKFLTTTFCLVTIDLIIFPQRLSRFISSLYFQFVFPIYS